MPDKKGVSQRQPDAPQLSASPLEAITPKPFIEKPFLSKYGYIATGGFMGGALIGLTNYMSKRPLLSGIHLYPVAAVAGAALVYYVQQYKESQWAERDAIIRHYISLHPEDFPPYNRVKIGTLFEDWTPVR